MIRIIIFYFSAELSAVLYRNNCLKMKQTNSYCISLLDVFLVFFAFLLKTQTIMQMIAAARTAPINAPATVPPSESAKKKGSLDI